MRDISGRKASIEFANKYGDIERFFRESFDHTSALHEDSSFSVQFCTTPARAVRIWAAGNRSCFLVDKEGWQHHRLALPEITNVVIPYENFECKVVTIFKSLVGAARAQLFWPTDHSVQTLMIDLSPFEELCDPNHVGLIYEWTNICICAQELLKAATADDEEERSPH